MNAAFLFCVRRLTYAHICLLLAFTIFGCVLVAEGQTSRTLSSAGRRLEEFNRQTEKAARDELRREMRGRRPTAEDRRQTQAKKEQIREDFEALQTAYNEILTKLHAQEQLSEAYVSDITAKIIKSGGRLRHNIAFPNSNAVDSENTELSSGSIKDLCLFMHKFLTNPVFETGVLDVIEAEKARHALDKIIQIAGSLQHKLGKSN
jgi:hypothetical protein